jgi:hypothetical protein
MIGPRAKTWKANLLVPVEDSRHIDQLYGLLRDVAAPKGFVRLLGLTGRREYDQLTEHLPDLVYRFRDDDVFATWTVVEAGSFSDNLAAGIEALGGAFFRSSVVVLRVPDTGERRDELLRLIADARRYGLGVALLSGTEGELGTAGCVHLVVDRPDGGWEIGQDLGDADLAFLIAYKLKTSWSDRLKITAIVGTDDEATRSKDYLEAAIELARIPNADISIASRDSELGSAAGDGVRLTLFSIDEQPDLDRIERRTEAAATPCLFVLDSGTENALV